MNSTYQLKLLYHESLASQNNISQLKQILITLENDNQRIVYENNDLKRKVKQMINEFTTYHDNVIKKVQEQNNLLNKQVEELKGDLIDNVTIITKLTHNISNLQKNCKDNNNKIVELEDSIKQKDCELITLQQQYKQKNYQFLDMKKVNQNLQQQLNNLRQQNQNNAILNKKSKYLQVSLAQQQSTKKNELLKEQNQILKNENLELQYQSIKSQQKNKQLQLQNDISFNRIHNDFVNLIESIRFGELIEQFTSQYLQYFTKVFESFQQLTTNNKRIEQQLQQYKQQVINLENKCIIKNSIISQLNQQINLLRLTNYQQVEALEAQYSGKIIQIQLKLRKQQMALALYQSNQQQFHQLQLINNQLQIKNNNIQQQKNILQETINRIIQDKQNIQKQNYQILALQQRINQTIEPLQRTLLIFIQGFMYLYHVNIKLRERNRKLFMPFIDYYFTIHKELNPVSYNKNHKFKVAVYSVIAIIRMKKNKQTYIFGTEGAHRHIKTASYTKKIGRFQLNEIYDIINQGDENQIEKIVQYGKHNLSFKLYNYNKLNLKINDDIRRILYEKYKHTYNSPQKVTY